MFMNGATNTTETTMTLTLKMEITIPTKTFEILGTRFGKSFRARVRNTTAEAASAAYVASSTGVIVHTVEEVTPVRHQ